MQVELVFGGSVCGGGDLLVGGRKEGRIGDTRTLSRNYHTESRQARDVLSGIVACSFVNYCSVCVRARVGRAAHISARSARQGGSRISQGSAVGSRFRYLFQLECIHTSGS